MSGASGDGPRRRTDRGQLVMDELPHLRIEVVGVLIYVRFVFLDLFLELRFFAEPRDQLVERFVIAERVDPLGCYLRTLGGLVQLQQVVDRPSVERLILRFEVRLEVQRR